jgi:hypothetical protein
VISRIIYQSGKRNFDAYLNETEVSLQATVDPYARADFFLSFARDPETGKYGVEVEEGYLTTLSLPARLQLKVGRFRSAVGRVNTVHPHALPFIDMPNAYVNYFGEELERRRAIIKLAFTNKSILREYFPGNIGIFGITSICKKRRQSLVICRSSEKFLLLMMIIHLN